jgi:hypothetical protein
MVCPHCGRLLEEPKAFCKFCGSRLPPQSASPAGPPPAPPLPGGAGTPPVVLPPLPSATDPSVGASQAPPATADATPLQPPAAPAAIPSGPQYEQLLVAQPHPAQPHPAQPHPAQPLPQPPPAPAAPADTPGHPRWLIPVLAVIAVIVVGTMIGGAMLLVSVIDGDGPMATDPVPSDNGPAATTPIEGATSGYVEALDRLDAVLVESDGRMVYLWGEITAAAPDVPDQIDQELADMQVAIDDAMGLLASEEPPQEYLPADDALFGAGDEMLISIDQTRQGIQAMWFTSDPDAGVPYLEAAGQAHDRFRDLFDLYRRERP